MYKIHTHTHTPHTHTHSRRAPLRRRATRGARDLRHRQKYWKVIALVYLLCKIHINRTFQNFFQQSPSSAQLLKKKNYSLRSLCGECARALDFLRISEPPPHPPFFFKRPLDGRQGRHGVGPGKLSEKSHLYSSHVVNILGQWLFRSSPRRTPTASLIWLWWTFPPSRIHKRRCTPQ